MQVTNVRAVLFVKDLSRVLAFYTGALAMTCSTRDTEHAVLNCRGFELVVQQVPKPIADTIVITQPPVRRTLSALRLDYPVANVDECRRLARALGGDIDATPPPWADAQANFFFGYDPEGNQFGVSAA
jgi:predicted enzyme related to lactoylglutathione lyase